MKFIITKNSLFYILFASLFLDSYKLFIIGNRNITLWYACSALLVLYYFIDYKNIIPSIRENIFSCLMIAYMLCNFLLYGDNLGALSIGLMCWIFYIISYRQVSVENFNNVIKFFLKGMKLMTLFGIYQFIGNLLGLPLTDLKLESINVEGYNWWNEISIGGIMLRRINAIFREPSYFSQFLALAIILELNFLINENISKKEAKNKEIWILLMFCALVLTFSGTGLVMLFLGAIYLVFDSRNMFYKKIITKYKQTIFCLFGIFIIFSFVPNTLFNYLYSRIGEFDSSNVESISAYLRFILPYEASIEILNISNYFYGIGIGNAFGFVLSSGFDLDKNMSPIFPRTIAEEGLIGLFFLCLFYLNFLKKSKLKISTYKAMLVGVFIMSFMHGTWSSEVYWLLLGFLNVKFIKSDIKN